MRHSYGEASYGEASYGEASYGEASYGEGEYHEDWFEDEGNRPTGHLPDGLERTAAYPDRRRANRPSADRDSTGYERPARYADSAGYERPAGYADSAAEPGASDAAGRYEFPTQAVRPPDGSYLRTSAGHDRGAVADLDGYSHERFVPPYVGSGGEGYPNDNPAAGPAPRHSAGGTAYLADRRSDSAEPGDYLSSPDSEAGYSGGSDYRLAADPGVTAEYATGRHSGQRMRSSPASPLAETELGASAEPLSDRDYWRRQAR